MDITEESSRQERDLKKLVKDILEVTSDTIAVAASPSTLWLLVLWNCSGGRGFNGYVTNPQAAQ